METVSFFTFLEEKITEILFQLFFLAVVAFLLIFYGVDTLFVVSLVILFISIQGLFQWCLYRKKRNASQHIIDLVDGLEETYYIADVLPKPKEFQNKAYCYALKKACKSMNDEIGKITEEKQDYQEYVESFVHEIKIPIGALSLTFDNTKNYTLKKETDKIFQLVEQMLYYARSENTEKDYFVKQLQLDEVIHNVILKFRHSLMERKAIINIHDIENVIYTDEKWLTFILSQIVQNAIKYFDKKNWHFAGRDALLMVVSLGTVGFLYLGEMSYQPKVLLCVLYLDPFLFSFLAGALVFAYTSKLYQWMKARNGGHAHFPFEKVVLPVVALLALSTYFYYNPICVPAADNLLAGF